MCDGKQKASAGTLVLGDDQKLDIVVTNPDVGGDTGVRGLSVAENKGKDPFLVVLRVRRGAPLNPRRSARPVPPKSTFASSLEAIVPLADEMMLGVVTVAIEMSEMIIESEAAESRE
jgi:hypothetical protein